MDLPMNELSDSDEKPYGDLVYDDPLAHKDFKEKENFDVYSAQVERRSISNLGVTQVNYVSNAQAAQASAVNADLGGAAQVSTLNVPN